MTHSLSTKQRPTLTKLDKGLLRSTYTSILVNKVSMMSETHFFKFWLYVEEFIFNLFLPEKELTKRFNLRPDLFFYLFNYRNYSAKVAFTFLV